MLDSFLAFVFGLRLFSHIHMYLYHHQSRYYSFLPLVTALLMLMPFLMFVQPVYVCTIPEWYSGQYTILATL